MEPKGTENVNIKEDSEQKNVSTILNKIHHKPLIMEQIYSFTQNRPYILLHLITNDFSLKASLKDVFDHAKKDNYLSKDLNTNICFYKTYRKEYEQFKDKYNEIKSNIFNYNEKLISLIECPTEKNKNGSFSEIISPFDCYNIDHDFIDSDYEKVTGILFNLFKSSKEKQIKAKNSKNVREYNYYNEKFYNSIIAEELKLPENKNINFSSKTLELFSQMSYYNYYNKKLMINNYYQNLNAKTKHIFLDQIFYFYEINNDYFKYNYNNLPYSTKKYRDFIKNEIKNNLKKENLQIYDNNKKQSIIYEIIKNTIKYAKEKERNKTLSLCYDYLTTLDNLFLYNLSNENYYDFTGEENNEFLDEKYLRYIENTNLKQKLNLICIINRYKYSEHINTILYPYINELHFTLFSNSSFDEKFMFSDLPIKDLYSIFITYFLTIKYYQNIQKISFGDEFFMNKNQFLLYNDEYYQSIISYLIDQYLINFINTGNNVLDKAGIKNIELKENNLNNIYEKYKIIYGFNKMFPNLENKKIEELLYDDIINNKHDNINDKECNYRIIEINFENKEIKEDLITLINNIKNFIFKNLSRNMNNIEIISFINLSFENNNENKINLNTFDGLKKLKEFFINNKTTSNKIQNVNQLQINNFEYIYKGYDKDNNLIYFRNGKNPIKSIDLLDILNLFNNSVIKMDFEYENIEISFNHEKTQLTIKNLNKENNKDNNNYQLNNISDLIKNLNNLTELIIEGFDFIFEEIQNSNIKKLSINYDNNSQQLYFYNIPLLNKKMNFMQKDIKIKKIFPLLEEIYIGNIKNENILFSQLFKRDNFSNNLNSINIITHQNFKGINFNNKNIKINIINKSINRYEKEKENEQDEFDDYEDMEEEDEYENEDLYNDKYENLFEDENPIVINEVKNRKGKNKKNLNEEEEEKEILLIKERLKPFKKIEKNIFDKDLKIYLKNANIIYFDSKIIKTVNQFYLIHQSLLLIKSKIDINKIKFKQLSFPKIDKINNNRENLIKFKKTKNLLIIFETDSTEINCIFSKNNNPEKKEEDFCLFINKNEVHYHAKEKNKSNKKNQNEISREKHDIFFKKNSRNIRRKINLMDVFFEDDVEFDIYDYNSDAFLEAYQINFNN